MEEGAQETTVFLKELQGERFVLLGKSGVVNEVGNHYGGESSSFLSHGLILFPLLLGTTACSCHKQFYSSGYSRAN